MYSPYINHICTIYAPCSYLGKSFPEVPSMVFGEFMSGENFNDTGARGAVWQPGFYKLDHGLLMVDTMVDLLTLKMVMVHVYVSL